MGISNIHEMIFFGGQLVQRVAMNRLGGQSIWLSGFIDDYSIVRYWSDCDKSGQLFSVHMGCVLQIPYSKSCEK